MAGWVSSSYPTNISSYLCKIAAQSSGSEIFAGCDIAEFGSVDTPNSGFVPVTTRPNTIKTSLVTAYAGSNRIEIHFCGTSLHTDKNQIRDESKTHQHTSCKHIQEFKHEMCELNQILSMIQCEVRATCDRSYLWISLNFSTCQESARNSAGSKGSGVVVAKRRACKA